MSLVVIKKGDVSHGKMSIPKETHIKDIMIDQIETVDEHSTVFEAVKIMKKNKIGYVIVMSPIFDALGIFTERDLLNKVVAEGLDIKKTKVSEVMTPHFECVQLEDSLFEIPKLMLKKKYRHIPVVSGHRVVGILSMKDILKFLIKGD